jgi:hypothetical protein
MHGLKWDAENRPTEQAVYLYEKQKKRVAELKVEKDKLWKEQQATFQSNQAQQAQYRPEIDTPLALKKLQQAVDGGKQPEIEAAKSAVEATLNAPENVYRKASYEKPEVQQLLKQVVNREKTQYGTTANYGDVIGKLETDDTAMAADPNSKRVLPQYQLAQNAYKYEQKMVESEIQSDPEFKTYMKLATRGDDKKLTPDEKQQVDTFRTKYATKVKGAAEKFNIMPQDTEDRLGIISPVQPKTMMAAVADKQTKTGSDSFMAMFPVAQKKALSEPEKKQVAELATTKKKYEDEAATHLAVASSKAGSPESVKALEQYKAAKGKASHVSEQIAAVESPAPVPALAKAAPATAAPAATTPTRCGGGCTVRADDTSGSCDTSGSQRRRQRQRRQLLRLRH